MGNTVYLQLQIKFIVPRSTLYAVSFCTWLVYIRADRLHRSADPLGVNLIRTPNSRFVHFGFNTLDATTRALSRAAFVLLSSFVYEA